MSTKCQKEKKLAEFSNKTKTQKHSYCKMCHSEYRKTHYKNNRTKYIQKAARLNKIQHDKARDFVISFKNKPCIDCNNSYPHYVMDFDHIDDNKTANVSWLVKHRSWDLDFIENEIGKCELVCSNCHRERTWKRQNIGRAMV